jgi:hypothetical protein
MQEKNTFKLLSMIMVPDELGTKSNKVLYQRLNGKTEEGQINMGSKKFGSEK